MHWPGYRETLQHGTNCYRLLALPLNPEHEVSLHQHSGPYLLSSDLDHGIGLFWCEEDQRPLTHRGSLASGFGFGGPLITVYIHLYI